MSNWKIRYKHDKDIVEIWCKVEHRTMPEAPYGVIKKPKDFGLVWHGEQMVKEMNKRGHDSTDFNRCKCKGGGNLWN